MESFAWPAVILILGMVSIFVFRQPLSRFIDRADRIDKSGIHATAKSQASNLEIKEPPAEELLKEFDNVLIVEKEKLIRSELERMKVGEGQERERFLIKLLAVVSLVQSFEKIYISIFGSQIGVLQYLNSAGSVSIDIVRPWYEQAIVQYPQIYNAYQFDGWLHFLKIHLLISDLGDKITITREGREFLKYLIQRGYSLHKHG